MRDIIKVEGSDDLQTPSCLLPMIVLKSTRKPERKNRAHEPAPFHHSEAPDTRACRRVSGLPEAMRPFSQGDGK